MGNNINFEDFLKEKHAETYMGEKDRMGEAFEDWSGALNYEEMLEYGDEFAQRRVDETELRLDKLYNKPIK